MIVNSNVIRGDFILVDLSYAPEWNRTVEQVFHSIAALYGEQHSLFADIKVQRSPYSCEVLLNRSQAVGFIIYQRVLRQNTLQLMHLELINPSDAGLGYRSRLLDRVEEIAKERMSGCIEIVVANRDRLRSYLLDCQFKQGSANTPDTMAHRPTTLLYRNMKTAAKTDEVRLHQVITPRKDILHIRAGHKKIEGKINNGHFLHVKAGEKIRFFCGQNQADDVTCEIIDVKKYESFPAMLTTEGYERCVPELKTFEAACKAYADIPGYTRKAQEHGVVAIHLKVVPKV